MDNKLIGLLLANAVAIMFLAWLAARLMEHHANSLARFLSVVDLYAVATVDAPVKDEVSGDE